MTKKHYELIASVFKEAFDPKGIAQTFTVRLLADEMAEALKLDNPKFDRERFLQACGVTG